MDKTEIINDFTSEFKLPADYASLVLNKLAEADSRYLRDLKMNVKNTLKSKHLSEKETALIALAIATNERNAALQEHFSQLALDDGASEEELAEIVACASLLSNNNVLYRFRHFMQKDEYQKIPAGMRMNIMMKPVVGKEFFELVSLAVSAVNACELCIKSHEKSLLDLGCTEDRIFDAIRLAAVIVSLTKVI